MELISLISTGDVDELTRAHSEAKQKGELELFVSKLSRQLNEYGMRIATGDEVLVEKETRQLLGMVLQLVKSGVCPKITPIACLQDMLEVSLIGRCERIFGIIEENLQPLKDIVGAQNAVLRMCNDLLKRLSTCTETSICGRVLAFLSRYLPLNQDSGLNKFGHFNTQNVTIFETVEESFSANELMGAPTDEDMETGEIKESKDSNIPVDHKLYTMFWQLQTFFSNPPSCYEKGKWPMFNKNLQEVFNLFASYKLEKPTSSHDSKKRKNIDSDAETMLTAATEEDQYFAKYLTSPKLLQLQLNDSQFRRGFLLQALIVFQYLTTDTKFKGSTHVLSDDQLRFVVESQKKCYNLLRETHPKGGHFASSIKHLLEREKRWSDWKNKSCEDMTSKTDKDAMRGYKKRPRVAFDPSVIDLGSAELTKLWNIEPDMLKACKDPKRKYGPSVREFISDPLDEMDPEQQVEEQYKSVHNVDFQWRCARLLVQERVGHLIVPCGQKPVNEYLETAITAAAMDFPELAEEIKAREAKLMAAKAAEEEQRAKEEAERAKQEADRKAMEAEERAARGEEEKAEELEEVVEEVMEEDEAETAKEKEMEEPAVEKRVNKEQELTDDQIESLALLLANHWEKLADALEITGPRKRVLREAHKQMSDIARSLLQAHIKGDSGRSVKGLRMTLLSAELWNEKTSKVLEMPSFFLSADSKRGRSVSKRSSSASNLVMRKGKLSVRDETAKGEAPKQSRRKRKMEQDEVSSDEGSGDERRGRAESASDSDYEDVHEKNYRQAKELLEKLKHDEVEGEEETAVGHRLKEDAQAKAGTLHRKTADRVTPLDEEEISHRGHRFTPVCAAFSPCGLFVVSCGKESSIVKYSLVEKKVVGVIKRTKEQMKRKKMDEEFEIKEHSGHIFAVAVSPDGKYIVSGGHDALVKVWDFVTLAHVKDLKGHRAPITGLTFRLKSGQLFSSSRDRSVKLWDVDQLGYVDTMFGHQDAVTAVDVLVRERAVCTGGQDRTARMWKVADESQLVFNGPTGCVSMDAIAMLNEDHFVTASADGSLSLWSVFKKKPTYIERKAHGQKEGASEARWVVSVAAVPYTDLLASGSDDGEIRLWQVAQDYKSLKLVYTYEMAGFINSLKFTAEGDMLAVAVGQEHKHGRWWVDKEARNQVVVIPLAYEGEERKCRFEAAKKAEQIAIDSDSGDDGEGEDEEE